MSLYKDLCSSPEAIYDAPFHRGFELTPEQLGAVHLEGARRRFDELKNRVSALGRLADEQGISRIDSLDDVVPLLFKHTVYKSYPLSYLERGRFDALTRWLDGLTSIDLSGVDMTGVTMIDTWIDRLDESTDLRVAHTSGTSGKLSVIPRTRQHWLNQIKLTAGCVRDWHGANSGPDLLAGGMPFIRPSERFGASAQHRAAEAVVELVAGSEENTLFLYPNDRFSADMASLAGRLRTAEARGEQGKLELSSALLERREEFLRRNAERPGAMKHFFEEAGRRFGGKDVFIQAIWVTLLDAAEEAQRSGTRGLFSRNSALTTGGDFKGRTVAPNWREEVVGLLGFDNAYEYYGMTEMISNAPRCSEGNYHVSPVTVPFLLDRETGKALPRTGTQTGRFAFLDLLADNYWGGLVTGDLVTMEGWDAPCACGRPGPYAHPNIRRFSEIEGGDDKINCAGAPEAHNRAMDFLVQNAGGE